MLYRIRGLAVIAGLCLFIAGGLFAQTPRELRFGTWVPGNLGEGQELWYSVRASETGLVVVETAGEIDTYLEAYDSSRTLIDEDDDGGEEYNARIEIFAQAGRTYLFKLRGYGEDESGPFEIRASFNSIYIRELRLDTLVSGTLDEGESHWFSVRPSGTGLVVVETFGDIDTHLKAFDASGAFIAEDDDGGEDLNARLDISAEAGKTYIFRLRFYNDEESGPYQIRADFEVIPPDLEQNTERSRAVPIKLGEPTLVYLRASSESRWYRYDIPRPRTLFVVQTRGNLDTVLVLYDARGNQISEDDDSGENTNALISERLDAGTVYIEVREFNGRSGRCTLHAEFR